MWLNENNTPELSKWSGADCPCGAFVCTNAPHHLCLHPRENAQTLRTLTGQSNLELLSSDATAISPPPWHMIVICGLVFLTSSREVLLGLGKIPGSAPIYKLQIHAKPSGAIARLCCSAEVEGMNVVWFAQVGWCLERGLNGSDIVKGDP